MPEKHLKDDNQKKDNSNTSLIQSTEEIKMCPICLATVTNRGLISGCSHEFCFECIRQWSTEQNRCPICRSVYSNIKYNIVSNEVFDEIPVEEQQESDDVESILHRFILIIRVISLRNRKLRQRDQLLDDLNETEEQMEGSNITRRQSKELKQRIQDILCERKRLDEEIRLFNETLTEDASDEQLMQVLSGRDAEMHEIEAIDLVFEPDDLFQDLDNPFELLQEQVSEEESANHSDNESESEEEVEEDNSRKRKYSQMEQNIDSDSDDSQEMPLKRPRRQ